MAVSRELTIDLGRSTPEAAAAQIIALMANPAGGPLLAKAALGAETSLLIQRHKVGLPVARPSRGRLNTLARKYRPGRPFGVQPDERVLKGIAVAHHVMPMILEGTNLRVSHSNQHRRLSLQACLRNLQAEVGQKDIRNIERRYWEASFPVLHLAAALNFLFQNLMRGGHLKSPDHALFNDANFIRIWLIAARDFEQLIAERWPKVASSRGQIRVALA